MKFRLGAIFTAAALACSGIPAMAGADEAALLRKVDRSFSAIAFGTSFERVRHGLRKVVIDDCEQTASCFWRDSRGVCHFFWGPTGPKRLTVKLIDARDFAGRPIAAFGIGRARLRNEVIERIYRFDRRITSDCDLERTRPAGGDECGLGIGQGWAVVSFDAGDRLTTIRLVVAEHY